MDIKIDLDKCRVLSWYWRKNNNNKNRHKSVQHSNYNPCIIKCNDEVFVRSLNDEWMIRRHTRWCLSHVRWILFLIRGILWTSIQTVEMRLNHSIIIIFVNNSYLVEVLWPTKKKKRHRGASSSSTCSFDHTTPLPHVSLVVRWLCAFFLLPNII